MRRKRLRLNQEQMLDFMVLWFTFLLFIAGSIITPDFYTAIIAVIILYIPLRFIAWRSRKKNTREILQSGIGEIDLMDGVQFENYLEALFLSMGFKVQVTAATGDFGADLILTKDGRTIAIQAKRYNKTVGVKAVQEVYASMPYYQATEAWVVTNNTFSKSAYELAEKSDIFLIDRGMLIEMIVNSKKASGI